MAETPPPTSEVFKPSMRENNEISLISASMVARQTEQVRGKIYATKEEKAQLQIIHDFEKSVDEDKVDPAKSALLTFGFISEAAMSNPNDNIQRDEIPLGTLRVGIVQEGAGFRLSRPDEKNVFVIDRVIGISADGNATVGIAGRASEDAPIQMSKSELLSLLSAHPNIVAAMNERELSADARQLFELNTAMANGENPKLPDNTPALIESAAGQEGSGLLSKGKLKNILTVLVPLDSPNREQTIDAYIQEQFGDAHVIDPLQLRTLVHDLALSSSNQTKEQIQQSVTDRQTRMKTLHEQMSMLEKLGTTDPNYLDARNALRDEYQALKADMAALQNYDAFKSLDDVFQGIEDGKIPKGTLSTIFDALSAGDPTKATEIYAQLNLSEEEQTELKKKLKELGPQFLKIGGPLLLILILSLAAEGLKKGTK